MAQERIMENLKMIRTMFEVMGHCLYHSLRHPKTEIEQFSNPVPLQLSPIPWWGSVGILIVGIVSWCFAAHWNIEGLAEAARAMVYCPLMHIFDMSWFLAKKINK
jgi:hypothetical protein